MSKDEKPEIPDNSNTTEKGRAVVKASAYIELLSKFLNLFTWQIIILIAIVMFYTPLRQMADLLPKKFESSSEISVLNVVTLKIQEQAKAIGNEELATIITGLSQDEIKWLLNLGGSGSYRVVGSDDGGTGIIKNFYIPLFSPFGMNLKTEGY